MVPGVIYKFRIVNLLKRDSLYNHGKQQAILGTLMFMLICVTNTTSLLLIHMLKNILPRFKDTIM